MMPIHKFFRGSTRENAEILEDLRIKRIVCTSPVKNIFKVCSQHPINASHLQNGRLAVASDEYVTELTKNAPYCAAVNVWVRSIKIAERFVDTPLLRFTHHPDVSRNPSSFQCDRQSQFERHIEPRSSRARPVQLHARQIVNRILRFFDK